VVPLQKRIVAGILAVATLLVGLWVIFAFPTDAREYATAWQSAIFSMMSAQVAFWVVAVLVVVAQLNWVWIVPWSQLKGSPPTAAPLAVSAILADDTKARLAQLQSEHDKTSQQLRAAEQERRKAESQVTTLKAELERAQNKLTDECSARAAKFRETLLQLANRAPTVFEFAAARGWYDEVKQTLEHCGLRTKVLLVTQHHIHPHLSDKINWGALRKAAGALQGMALSLTEKDFDR
jgi:hypothetical protein